MTTTYGAILAAGLGTRLRPLTNHVPKPSLPICGRPLLEYGIDLLAGANVDGVGVNVHYQAAAFSEGFEARPWPIKISHEELLLGTGGGLKKIASLFPRSRFISINGDALLECDLAPIIKRHEARGALATMVLRRVPATSPFARVGYDKDHQIFQISEVGSPSSKARSLTYGAFTGVQIVEPELLDMVDDGPCDVIRTGYREALAVGLPIFADFVDGLWIDVGTPQRYFEANLTLANLNPDAKLSWRLPPSAVNTPPACWIHPHSSVGDDVTIGPNVVVNCPARIVPGISLTNVVCSTATEIQHSATNVIAYEEGGITQHIELESR